MTAKTFFRNAGALRQLTKVFYRDAGVLRTIRKIYYRDAGALRLVFDTAGGGGGGSNVNITGDFVAYVDDSAVFTFQNNGIFVRDYSNVTNEWLTTANQNTTEAALYEVQLTFVNYARSTYSGPATGTYWPLSTTREWGFHIIGINAGTGSCAATFTFRRASDQVVVATADFDMDFEQT